VRGLLTSAKGFIGIMVVVKVACMRVVILNLVLFIFDSFFVEDLQISDLDFLP
jgi:hypothetical protein